jgi:hypothetical protein
LPGLKAHTIKRITIHHTANRQRPDMPLPKKLQKLQRFSQSPGKLASGKSKPAWPDIPYHFYIDANGKVAEARDPAFTGDTSTEYDPTGHLLIVLEGNFEKEAPTPQQLRALEGMLLWAAAKYRVAADRIAGHRDFAKTACPGKQLYARIADLRTVVSRAQKANTPASEEKP